MHHGKSFVVHAYPKPVFTVCIKRFYSRNIHRSVYTFKTLSVIADKSSVTAYPDKSLACLCDSIRFGSRQSVFIIVPRIDLFKKDDYFAVIYVKLFIRLL